VGCQDYVVHVAGIGKQGIWRENLLEISFWKTEKQTREKY